MNQLINRLKKRKFRISGFLLLLLFLSAELRPLLPWVDYYVNFEYIKDVLCINKDDESFKCDGKCYLRAELNDKSLSDNSEKNQPKPSRIEWEKQNQIIEEFNHEFTQAEDVNDLKFFLSESEFPLVNIKPLLPPPKTV